MIHADTMCEASMRRTGECEFGNAELLYAPETLKLGRIDELPSSSVNLVR
jgi:hypothetical protein